MRVERVGRAASSDRSAPTVRMQIAGIVQVAAESELLLRSSIWGYFYTPTSTVI